MNEVEVHRWVAKVDVDFGLPTLDVAKDLEGEEGRAR